MGLKSKFDETFPKRAKCRWEKEKRDQRASFQDDLRHISKGRQDSEGNDGDYRLAWEGEVVGAPLRNEARRNDEERRSKRYVCNGWVRPKGWWEGGVFVLYVGAEDDGEEEEGGWGDVEEDEEEGGGKDEEEKGKDNDEEGEEKKGEGRGEGEERQKRQEGL